MILDPIDSARVARIRQELEKAFSKPLSHEEVEKFMPGVMYRRTALIQLTKLNQSQFGLNPELIETIEEKPDTVISLVTGRKYIVMEPFEEVRRKIMEYKREIVGKGT